MENVDQWERNRQIEEYVEVLFAESDKKAFEIMRKIAAKAVMLSGQIGKAPDSESGNL